MRIDPKPGDSPEELALMSGIDMEWKNLTAARKEMEAADKRHGILRAKLRLLHEGLVEGELLVMLPAKQPGKLEVSADMPYLWLRLLDKSGAPSKRRLMLHEDEGGVTRPDGTTPVWLHPRKALKKS